MRSITYYKYIVVISVIILHFILSGCEEDKNPISSEEFVITVNSINQSDINENSILEKDENISNNSGNPWGEFIKITNAQCGTDPAGFQILNVSVQLIPKDGIEAFEDVVSGKITAYFINTQHGDSESDRVVIGSINTPSGKGPVDLENLASSADLNLIKNRLIGGDFHVGFNAETDLSDDDSFAFDVMIRFQVKAYCQ